MHVAQAQDACATYLLAMPGEKDSMLYWLAKVTKDARERASRKLVHVGASADMDQSSVSRFEKAAAWPRDPDRLVRAYAHDLDSDSIELWEEAVRQWRASLSSDEQRIAAQADLEQLLEEQAGRRRDEQQRRRGTGGGAQGAGGGRP